MKRIWDRLFGDDGLLIVALLLCVVWVCVMLAGIMLSSSRARGDEPVAVKVVKAWDAKECDGRQCQLHRYEWRERADDPRRYYLYKDGVQLGGWDYDKCHWRWLMNDQWGSPEDQPPVQVPGIEASAPIGSKEQKFPFGVDRDKLPSKDEYSINGKKCHPRYVFDAMAADQLTDDSGKPWLVVIGTDEERKAVEAAWNSPACDEVRGQFRVWSVPSSHWSVDDEGFPAGSPTIIWEKSGGNVLYRQMKFVSAEQLATTSKAAIRKADPKYDPKKDADPLSPPPAPRVDPTPSPTPVVYPDFMAWLRANWVLPALLVGIVAVVVLTGKKS